MGAAGARAARSEPPLSACLVRRGAAGRSRAAAGGARKPPGAGHSARRGGRGPGRRPSPDRCRPRPRDLPGVWPLLVVGDAGRRTHAHLPRRREGAAARALRRTGFYVLPGDPGDVFLLDGESPPAGGHDGAFGYELSVGGMRIVVDAGAGGEQPPPWGEYFRSTRAHNVVSVAGAEQRANGRVPAVSDVHWVARDGLLYFSGTHDGFARLALDLRLNHRPRVFCLPGRFLLVCA